MGSFTVSENDYFRHGQRRPVIGSGQNLHALLYEGPVKARSPKPPATAAWMPIKLLAVQTSGHCGRTASRDADVWTRNASDRPIRIQWSVLASRKHDSE